MTLTEPVISKTQPQTRFQAAGDSTRAVHAGARRDKPFHALIDPIVQTATYAFDSLEDIQDFLERHDAGEKFDRYEYGRYGNPTVEAVAERIAALEGADEALLFSSGMAAVTTALLALLGAGTHMVITDDLYRRTREFTNDFLLRYGVGCSVVPMGDYAALESAIRPETRVILSETPTNPYLRVLDVERVAALARRRGVLTMLDTTFATPVNLRPMEYGIDLIVHSATKYLGGHHDLLAGAVAGRADLVKQIADCTATLGGVLSPQNAYLLGRGLKSLALRVRHQNASGQQVAEYLEGHPVVERVWYPGLASHPDHAVAQAQMKGFGGVVSFTVRGGLESTARFIDRLQIPYTTPSLGGTESLVVQPALMSYHHLSAAERAAIGIEDNLVRFALGIEDPADIIADLEQALAGAA